MKPTPEALQQSRIEAAETGVFLTTWWQYFCVTQTNSTPHGSAVTPQSNAALTGGTYLSIHHTRSLHLTETQQRNNIKEQQQQ